MISLIVHLFFDRPIADSVSIKAHDIHQMRSTIKHEILHALEYAFYRDCNGVPLTPRFKGTDKPKYNETLSLYQWSDRVVKIVVRPDWKVRSGITTKTVNLMVIPRVQEEVRNSAHSLGEKGV